MQIYFVGGAETTISEVQEQAGVGVIKRNDDDDDDESVTIRVVAL